LDEVKAHNAYLLLLLGLFSVALADDKECCLTDEEPSTIISRWTSIAIKIDLKVMDETVTDNLEFFPDSQDFLEGLPVSFAENLGHLCSGR
jgi:hypothetical protein